jgi:hypothetical protein
MHACFVLISTVRHWLPFGKGLPKYSNLLSALLSHSFNADQSPFQVRDNRMKVRGENRACVSQSSDGSLRKSKEPYAKRLSEANVAGICDEKLSHWAISMQNAS